MTHSSAMPADARPRYALVTGAANGLGRAFALRLARAGWTLSLADVDEAGAEETKQQVKAAGGIARVDTLDVRRLNSWNELLRSLRADWPQLDLLVNNAGVVAAGEVGKLPIDVWQRVIDTNLWGVVHGCHVCADWLSENPQGAAVVNIASIMGLISSPTLAAYNVSKAGIISLSETLRVEWAGRGVRVVVVCPGFFATQLLAAGTFCEPDQLAYAEALTRRARLTADDVAAAALEALDQNTFYVVLPQRARRLWRWKRWLPERFLGWIAREFQSGVPKLK